jgi:hypothetical protein
MALGSTLTSCGFLVKSPNRRQYGWSALPHGSRSAPHPSQFPPKAKRVIYIHMAGSPSQLELFDYKPELAKYNGKDCPQELLTGKKFAFIRGVPKMLGPQGKFAQYGQSGAWVIRLPASFADRGG